MAVESPSQRRPLRSWSFGAPDGGSSPSRGDHVWQNWSRTATATPARTASPGSVHELAEAVGSAARAGLRVRAVGAGHSFTPAAVTDGLMLSLDGVRRIERVEPAADGTARITVGAGIRLFQLNRALAALDLAMANLGDIDQQSIAGAISTGTHGTGAGLGGLASMVCGVGVVLPDGRLVRADASAEPELFEAARLGLGAVGILATVTLECVPAFLLRALEEPMPLDAVLERLDGPDGLVEANDHFEFYWFPHTRNTLTKRNNRVDSPDTEPGWARARRWVDDQFLSNTVFEWTNRLVTRRPQLTERVNGLASRALRPRTFVAPSYEVFASPRRVVFREMEYAVPRAALPHVLGEIDAWLRRSGERVPFPLEIRFAAADDVWLSTAHGRETAYVAVHQYWRLSHAAYFAAVEGIMAEVDGRPHWGKLHNLDAERLRGLYPRFDDFRAVRARIDPHGTFANPYTDRVFGLP